MKYREQPQSRQYEKSTGRYAESPLLGLDRRELKKIEEGLKKGKTIDQIAQDLKIKPAKMAERLREGRWNLPEQIRRDLPADLTSMIKGENGESDRHKLMASRVLIMLEKQNQDDEHLLAKIEEGFTDNAVTVNVRYDKEPDVDVINPRITSDDE